MSLACGQYCDGQESTCEGEEVLSLLGERPEESVRDEFEVEGCLSQTFRHLGKTQKHKQPCVMFSGICEGADAPPVDRLRQAVPGGEAGGRTRGLQNATVIENTPAGQLQGPSWATQVKPGGL